MAHSFIKHRGRRSRINDTDLAVALCVLIDIVRTHKGGISNEYEDELRRWIGIVKESGPGCIELPLDTFLSSPDRSQSMQLMLSRASEFLDQYGATVPDEIVNRELGLTGMLAIKSFPVSHVKNALAAIAELVKSSQ